MARIMGLDFGSRRIGVAMSDASGLVAAPVRTIVPKMTTQSSVEAWISEAVQEVGRLVKGESVGTVVVGLPKTLAGGESASTQGARALAEALQAALSVPVVLWDERLSTKEALAREREMGRDERRARPGIDERSAAIVLQSFLDTTGRSARGGATEEQEAQE